jgi:hypothetical protein
VIPLATTCQLANSRLIGVVHRSGRSLCRMAVPYPEGDRCGTCFRRRFAARNSAVRHTAAPRVGPEPPRAVAHMAHPLAPFRRSTRNSCDPHAASISLHACFTFLSSGTLHVRGRADPRRSRCPTLPAMRACVCTSRACGQTRFRRVLAVGGRYVLSRGGEPHLIRPDRLERLISAVRHSRLAGNDHRSRCDCPLTGLEPPGGVLGMGGIARERSWRCEPRRLTDRRPLTLRPGVLRSAGQLGVAGMVL